MPGRVLVYTLHYQSKNSTLTTGGTLKFRGVGYDLFDDRTDYDAQVKSVDGMESIQADVKGSSASFGGSVYSGIRANDREIVFTLSVDPDKISYLKNQLNSYIGVSESVPLVLSVYTAFKDGGELIYTTDVYISDITSPPFSKDSQINLTLKSGASTFQRKSVKLNDSTFQDSLGPMFAHPAKDANGNRTYTKSIELSQLTLDNMSAPSDFSMLVEMNKSLFDRVQNVIIQDSFGGEVIFFKYGGPGFGEYNTRFFLALDGFNRTLSQNGEGAYENQKGLLRNFGYVMENGWPKIRPVSHPLTVSVVYKDPEINPNDFWFTDFTYTPRIYGF